MSQVGYARVSSTGQSLAVQLAKLQHCNKVFSEKKSATSTNGRTALKDCLSYLREGDQLVITRQLTELGVPTRNKSLAGSVP